jgi:hypothetical protein
MDSGGLGRPQFQARWTLTDPHGHRLVIYGSGGWVFESPRARYMKPPDEVAVSAFEIREPIDLSDVRVPKIVETHEAVRVSHHPPPVRPSTTTPCYGPADFSDTQPALDPCQPPPLRATLGAIRGGPRRSWTDTGGNGSPPLNHLWTDVDAHGQGLGDLRIRPATSPSKVGDLDAFNRPDRLRMPRSLPDHVDFVSSTFSRRRA